VEEPSTARPFEREHAGGGRAASPSPGEDGGDADGGAEGERRSGGPVVLADRQRSPQGLAVADGFVVWANAGSPPDFVDGSVMRAAVGGADVAAIAAGELAPSGVAIEGGRVYWTTAGNRFGSSLYSCHAAGEGAVKTAPLGGGSALEIAAGLWCPNAIGVDAASVFVSTAGSPLAIRKIDGAVSILSSEIGGESGPAGLALDAANVYLAGGAGWRVPKSGGAAEGLVWGYAPGTAASGVAVDPAGRVWFAALGGVERLPGDGALGLELEAPGFANASAVVVDGDHVYWADAGTAELDFTDGAVFRAPEAGGEIEVVAAEQHRPLALALDATHVYWTNEGAAGVVDGGSVVRAPK
jgi:hypothetical protein